ncbi:trihelix transcription factor ASR3-like [Phalaenopsis equestris]|uniref:trihelix transcription factor ASR3-like n=1 Tax=Phalaenopsis equestris TaxID=78828 RepID=UPI0009E64DA5|nr:trihelix transcription factor ASR3-like [Phalaenopsis equestris]
MTFYGSCHFLDGLGYLTEKMKFIYLSKWVRFSHFDKRVLFNHFGMGGWAGPPRLPRWTRQEILVLIQGKRVVESRGRGRASTSAVAIEPKWAAVSSYCRRQGVNRGAVQCRKRWSNLAGDYKKIKEWEMGRSVRGEAESFWGMRNDLRRERKLPGFFDREVYDILDGVVSPAVASTAAPAAAAVEEEGDGEEVVFDSGRSAADDGLFSDFEEEKEVDEDEESEMGRPTPPVEVLPISEKKLVLVQEEESTPGPSKHKQTTAENCCKDSPKRENHKRRRTSDEDDEHSSGLPSQIVELLDRNNRMLAAQLESQNVNTQLDREQRKDQVNGLLVVLNKLADAIGRIADKL